MRKILWACGTAALLCTTWAAQASGEDYRPEARAFLSYGFGGTSREQAPLAFGLRFDLAPQPYAWHTDSVLGTPETAPSFLPQHPALLQFGGDTRGNALAQLNGVPFAGHIAPLNDDDSSSSGSSPPASSGGFSWFDWGLLAVGLGGAGYLIAEATRGKDSPDPKTSSSSSGGTTGGGGTTTCTGTVVLGICVP